MPVADVIAESIRRISSKAFELRMGPKEVQPMAEGHHFIARTSGQLVGDRHMPTLPH